MHLLTFCATDGLLLISLFPIIWRKKMFLIVPLWMILWEIRYVHSAHLCLKSDTFFHVYHLICCHLYIHKYLFQDACTKSSFLHVSQAFALKMKLLSLLLYIFLCMLMAQIVLLCCTSHCVLSGNSRHIPIDLSKLSYCSLNINCYFTDITFFTFVPSKQHDPLSYLQLSMLIDKILMER